MCHTATNQKEAGVAIVIPDNVDFRAVKTIKDGERHYIKAGQPMKDQRQAVLKVYESSTRTVTYVKTGN